MTTVDSMACGYRCAGYILDMQLDVIGRDVHSDQWVASLSIIDALDDGDPW